MPDVAPHDVSASSTLSLLASLGARQQVTVGESKGRMWMVRRRWAHRKCRGGWRGQEVP